MALSEKSPYPRSSPGLGQPVAIPAFLTRTASKVGTDLRAVRHRRHGAFGEIALPPELAGPWPACRKTRVPDPNSLLGRDRSPSGPAPQTLALSEKSPYPRSCSDNAQPTIQWDHRYWLDLLTQERRCWLLKGPQSARASLSPRLMKESVTPSPVTQTNCSGSGARNLFDGLETIPFHGPTHGWI